MQCAWSVRQDWTAGCCRWEWTRRCQEGCVAFLLLATLAAFCSSAIFALPPSLCSCLADHCVPGACRDQGQPRQVGCEASQAARRARVRRASASSAALILTILHSYLIEAIAEARDAKAQQPASAAASAVRNLAEQPPPPGAAYAGRRKRARSDEEAAMEKRVKTE